MDPIQNGTPASSHSHHERTAGHAVSPQCSKNKGLFGVEAIGVGAFAPPTVIHNNDLTQLVDTSDEWIQSRTGIVKRHVVSGAETTFDLAYGAAVDALASAGLTGKDIDFIIVATSTPDAKYPFISSHVQAAIGADRAAGFDMALACTGFTAALVVAQQFIRAGTYQTILVIGSDVHSRHVDWTDRNTCVLFGDGGGAVILRACADNDHFLAFDMGFDGDKGQMLTVTNDEPNCPLVEPRPPIPAPHSRHVYMNGREVFKFAVDVVPRTLADTVQKAGLTFDDIDYLVLHQANARIMQAIAERLNIPIEKMIMNMQEYGNTSAASIPLALNEAVLDGRIRPGHKLLFCGFGAGLSWATCVMEWTCVDQRLLKDMATAQPTKQTATV